MQTKISNIIEDKKGKIFSVKPDEIVYDTIKLMADNNIGAVLVMDGEKLEGIFTERDYMKKLILQGRTSKETAVKDVMTTKVTVISPDLTLDECLAVMAEKHCRHLPVVQGDKLLGVISIGDLAERIIKDQKGTITNLNEYIAGMWDQGGDAVEKL